MTQTSITYRLPGGMSATYSGDPKSRLVWFLETWRAGLALRHMWFTVAFWLVGNGVIPQPSSVTTIVVHIFKRVADDARSGE